MSFVLMIVECYAMYRYHELALIVKIRLLIMVYYATYNLLPTSTPVLYDASTSDKSLDDSQRVTHPCTAVTNFPVFEPSNNFIQVLGISSNFVGTTCSLSAPITSFPSSIAFLKIPKTSARLCK